MFNLRCYWTKVHQIFTRFSDIVAAVNACTDMAKLQFIVECQSFDVCKWTPKISWLPQQHPLGDRKGYVYFVIPINVSTICENLVKIGLSYSEIFGTICYFLPSCCKNFKFYFLKFWGYWSKFLHNVALLSLLLLMRGDIAILLWNASAKNEGSQF